MDKKQRGLMIGIGFAVLVVVIEISSLVHLPSDIKKARANLNVALGQLNSFTTGDYANLAYVNINGRAIGNVSIPLALDKGKFLGKLDQLNILPSDLPASLQPVHLMTDRAECGYAKNPLIMLAGDRDATQFFTCGVTNATADSLTNASIEAGVSVATFTTTYGSSLYYALQKQHSSSPTVTANQPAAPRPQYLNIGYDNIVVEDAPVVSADGQPTSTYWTVLLLVSNAEVQLNFHLPANANIQLVQSLVTNWLSHVGPYQRGTQADVTSENLSGFTIGGQ